MNNFKGKCDAIFEAHLTRYQQNGFLSGDYVKISKKALTNEFVKRFSNQMKIMIEDVLKKDIPLRVSAIKTSHANALGGSVGMAEVPGVLWADVVIEYAPGMWRSPMTLPVEILEKVAIESESSTGDTGMSGYAPYSKEIVYPGREFIKPVEAKATNNREEAKSENYNLPTKNTKLANSKGAEQPKVDKPKKLKEASEKYIKNETDIINEVYGKMNTENVQPIVEHVETPPHQKLHKHDNEILGEVYGTVKH